MEYHEILQDLRAKRAAIDDVIQAMERLSDVGTSPTGAYVGMTVADAAKKFIRTMKRPCSTNEIVEALGRGGLQHNSKDLYSTVYAILRQQAKKSKAFVRVANDWTIPELTGEHA